MTVVARIFKTVKNLILTDTSYIIVLDDGEQIECQHDDIVAVSTGGKSYTKIVTDLVVDDTFIAMIGTQKEVKNENTLF